MTDIKETATLNDRFRKTVPFALVIFPGNTDARSPFLGLADQILAAVIHLEFPAGDRSIHDGALMKFPEFDVRWEIREARERDGVVPSDGSFVPFTVCTDLWGVRRKAGEPWNVPELEAMYRTHRLVVYIPAIDLP